MMKRKTKEVVFSELFQQKRSGAASVESNNLHSKKQSKDLGKKLDEEISNSSRLDNLSKQDNGAISERNRKKLFMAASKSERDPSF